MRSVSTPNPHPLLLQLRHPWHQTLCRAEWVLLARWHLPGLPLIHQPECLAAPSSVLFVCLSVGIKSGKPCFASCWKGRHPRVVFSVFLDFFVSEPFLLVTVSWLRKTYWRLSEVRTPWPQGPLKVRAYWHTRVEHIDVLTYWAGCRAYSVSRITLPNSPVFGFWFVILAHN